MTELSLSSPWLIRFKAWVDQRFALPNALLFFILYLTTALVARHGGAVPAGLHWLDVLGCGVTWSFFLLLRVFDEHKDYALDCQNHPDRVLQRGLITLTHLKWVGAASILLQVGFALASDASLASFPGPVLLAWLAMFGWTCLMGKEFFVEEWLNRHLTWYAISHMLVMPLIVWWLAQMAQPGTTFSLPLKVLMLLAFLSGFCFEITRKTKGPEEERDSIESYSRIFGTRGSALVVMALVTAMVLCQIGLLAVLTGDIAQVPVWAGVILAVFWVLGIRQLMAFYKVPSLQGRERNEKAVALTMLAGYAVVMAVILCG